MTKTAVIIPALNEAGNIGQLVSDLRARLPVQVILVDNGSTDNTAAQVRSAGARVVFEAHRGYGFACQCGVNAAQEATDLSLTEDRVSHSLFSSGY